MSTLHGAHSIASIITSVPLKPDKPPLRLRTRARPLLPLKKYLFKRGYRYDRDTGFVYRRGHKLEAKNTTGELIVSFPDPDIPKHRRVILQSRMAWLLGHDEDPGPYPVRHINGDVLDNSLNNLILED